MSDQVVILSPTMHLRIVRREVKLNPFYVPNTAIERVIQQMFVGTDGSERWIDIPEIEEPTRMGAGSSENQPD